MQGAAAKVLRRVLCRVLWVLFRQRWQSLAKVLRRVLGAVQTAVAKSGKGAAQGAAQGAVQTAVAKFGKGAAQSAAHQTAVAKSGRGGEVW